VFVGAEIVDPELVGPRLLGGGFAVEEEDVGLTASPARTALGVEDACRQAEQRVNVGLFE
jgi:hypothetical protein